MFDIIILGSNGGPVDHLTSSYLIKKSNTKWGKNCCIAIDAGCLVSGIQNCIDKFPINNSWEIVEEYIESICITHPHMDHISGLVVNSAGFSKCKRICGLPKTIDALKRFVFNGTIWPDLVNVCINLETVELGKEFKGASNDKGEGGMVLRAMKVSHAEYSESTCFIVKCADDNNKNSEDYMLIFGDVGPDELSKSDNNLNVWKQVEKLGIQKLKAIMIECSFDDSKSEPLYGHMTPAHLIKELKKLSTLTDNNLQGVTIVATHIKNKPTGSSTMAPQKQNKPHDIIYSQLVNNAEEQNLKCKFIIARSGNQVSI